MDEKSKVEKELEQEREYISKILNKNLEKTALEKSFVLLFIVIEIYSHFIIYSIEIL